MYVEWESKKGNQTTENRDAGGILISQSTIFSIIADASPKGTQGIELVNRLIKEVITTLSKQARFSPSNIVTIFKQTHQKLRIDFIHETASYAALYLPNKGREGLYISCGDCRVGKIGNCELEWLSTIHTLSNAIDHTDGDSTSPQSHIITRCFKSTRFDTPDINTICCNNFDQWILATDGAWRNSTEDDNSTLKLKLTDTGNNAQIKSDSDCDNWQQLIIL